MIIKVEKKKRKVHVHVQYPGFKCRIKIEGSINLITDHIKQIFDCVLSGGRGDGSYLLNR